MNEDTPRTNSNAADGWSGDAICVSAEFARELEREGNAMRAELKVWRDGGLTEEVIRENDGFIKVGNGCAVVCLADALESAALDALRSMCGQHCDTRKAEKDYNGQVAGSLVTDSGAITANATALQLLAEHGRFRIVAEGGRMVVGYWPENEPVPPNSKVSDAKRSLD